MRMKYLICVLLLSAITVQSQEIKVYPTHWWAGMKNKKLQLMVHSKQQLPVSVSVQYPGLKLIKVSQPENKNYVFIDLEMSSTIQPGNAQIRFSDGRKLSYSIKARNKDKGRIQGVTSSDFIYLIMPDRFSNGDSSNDRCVSCRDKTSDRNDPFSRHGGDLRGVENRLDYLKDLGVTTVWMTPIMQNDMPKMQEGRFSMSGYHGYWITDHYNVDPRFGSNDDYKRLVSSAHARGMKIIQDAVYNHVGEYHHTVQDLPMKDWLNQWPKYQGSNHREEVFMDPYVSAADKKIMVGGWFVPHLPDLNLANPFVATYIIQNTIWATEEFGIDGWRVDTYKYCDEKFLNNINTALESEFPRLTVFGEAWTRTVPAAAYFVQNNLNTPFKHNAQGVTDFPLNGAIYSAIKDHAGWSSGIGYLYAVLSEDFMYKNPLRNCIFLDNHDMDRALSVVGENVNTLKMGLGLLLTLRGIPEMYYGTEVLMKNTKNPTDAEVRRDFPGGWASDGTNKFQEAGRDQKENEVFDYVKKLANYRKTSSALTTGKTLHFIPQDGTYVFFRYNEKQTVMCILNTKEQEINLDLTRYSERLKGFTNALDVVSNTTQVLNAPINIKGRALTILDLK